LTTRQCQLSIYGLDSGSKHFSERIKTAPFVPEILEKFTSFSLKNRLLCLLIVNYQVFVTFCCVPGVFNWMDFPIRWIFALDIASILF